jgi:hypothetical protein
MGMYENPNPQLYSQYFIFSFDSIPRPIPAIKTPMADELIYRELQKTPFLLRFYAARIGVWRLLR